MLALLRRYFSAGPPWLTCLPFLFAYGLLVGLFGDGARMLANYPYSHYAPHWLSLVYLVSNAGLLLVAGAGLRRSRGRIAPRLVPLATLTAFALLGSLALAAYPRQLYVLWPAILLVAVSGQRRARETSRPTQASPL